MIFEIVAYKCNLDTLSLQQRSNKQEAWSPEDCPPMEDHESRCAPKDVPVCPPPSDRVYGIYRVDDAFFDMIGKRGIDVAFPGVKPSWVLTRERNADARQVETKHGAHQCGVVLRYPTAIRKYRTDYDYFPSRSCVMKVVRHFLWSSAEIMLLMDIELAASRLVLRANTPSSLMRDCIGLATLRREGANITLVFAAQMDSRIPCVLGSDKRQPRFRR